MRRKMLRLAARMAAKRRRWTDAEDYILENFWRMRYSAAAIARCLNGRSVESIWRRRRYLELPIGHELRSSIPSIEMRQVKAEAQA